MEALPTPRPTPPDAKLECWSDEIEDLLSEWAEVSMCFSYLHNYSTRKYKHKYHHLQIPIIILSTLTGTANFATDSYVPVDYQHGFSAGVGTLNIACGILGQDCKRKPCREFLKVCRSEYDNLLESSPNIDLDIISMFNKKFDGKYTEVRRPIICNGLKEIKAYRIEKDEEQPDRPKKSQPQEEPQAEPEPELEY